MKVNHWYDKGIICFTDVNANMIDLRDSGFWQWFKKYEVDSIAKYNKIYFNIKKDPVCSVVIMTDNPVTFDDNEENSHIEYTGVMNHTYDDGWRRWYRDAKNRILYIPSIPLKLFKGKKEGSIFNLNLHGRYWPKAEPKSEWVHLHLELKCNQASALESGLEVPFEDIVKKMFKLK